MLTMFLCTEDALLSKVVMAEAAAMVAMAVTAESPALHLIMDLGAKAEAAAKAAMAAMAAMGFRRLILLLYMAAMYMHVAGMVAMVAMAATAVKVVKHIQTMDIITLLTMMVETEVTAALPVAAAMAYRHPRF